MKFCKKCHKRVVGKVENNVDLSVGSIKVCVCDGRVGLLHDVVIKRLVSEVGVHEVKKFKIEMA